MSRRHRVRNALKPTILFKPVKGVVPEFKVLPLVEYEKLTGRRVNEFERIENGHVEFVVERNGSIRYLRVQESAVRYSASGQSSNRTASRTDNEGQPEQSVYQHSQFTQVRWCCRRDDQRMEQIACLCELGRTVRIRDSIVWLIHRHRLDPRYRLSKSHRRIRERKRATSTRRGISP
jgi:hypothetical protein